MGLRQFVGPQEVLDIVTNSSMVSFFGSAGRGAQTCSPPPAPPQSRCAPSLVFGFANRARAIQDALVRSVRTARFAESLPARDAIVTTSSYYSSELPCARTIRRCQSLMKRG